MGVKGDSGMKNPKKPFIYYYLLVLLIVMVLNALVFPSVMERSRRCPTASSSPSWTKKR